MAKRRASSGLVNPRSQKKAKLSPPVAKAVRSQIKRELRKAIEAKQWDQTQSVTVSSTGAIADISSLVQGAGEFQRTGDQANPSSVEVRGVMRGADASNLLRVMLIQWHPDDATSGVGVSGVLEPAIITAGFGVLSPYNDQNRALFRVLKDQTFTTSAAGSDNKAWHWNITKPMRPFHFNGSAQTGNDKLYLIFISDSAAAAHVGMDIVTRVRYRDA